MDEEEKCTNMKGAQKAWQLIAGDALDREAGHFFDVIF
jgi:hypothetical protein